VSKVVGLKGGIYQKMKNVAIYWDFDNIQLSIQRHYGQSAENIAKLIQKIEEIYSNDSIRIHKAFADFEKITKTQTDLQKKKVTPIHVFSSNSGSESRKNASDIELCLDVLETALTNEDINEFVIVSADKDMIPLLSKLRYHGKRTFLIYLDKTIAEDKLLINFANQSSSIEELIEMKLPDPSELTREKIEAYSEEIVNIATAFFDRNKFKPTIFLGKTVFVKEITDKIGLPVEIVEQIITHCIDTDKLTLVEFDGGKIKYELAKKLTVV